MPKKNEEIRTKIVNALKKAKAPMSRAQLASKLGEEANKLPLAEMKAENLIEQIGERKLATYKAK